MEELEPWLKRDGERIEGVREGVIRGEVGWIEE